MKMNRLVPIAALLVICFVAPLFAEDVDDYCILINAVENGDSTTVRVLINNGMDVNDWDEYGTTPLMIAASNGHTDIVRLLLNAGADVNVQSEYGYTALILALCLDARKPLGCL